VLDSNVSIVVPCLNEEKTIGRCIESFIDNGDSFGRSELLIVDGMSTDRTREIVDSYAQDHEQIRLIDNPGKRTSLALNIGIGNAEGRYIGFMGAHSYVDSGYLKSALTCLEDNPDIACAGGMKESTGSTPFQRIVSGVLKTGTASGSRRFSGSFKGYVKTVPYGIYRKEVFETYGRFREDLICAEDFEFNMRLVRNGEKIYQDSSIKSFYYPRATLHSLMKQYLKYGFYKSKAWIFYNTVTAANILPAAALSAGIIAAVLSFFSRLSAVILCAGAGLYVMAAVLSMCVRIRSLSDILLVPVRCGVLGAIHLSFASGYLYGMMYWILIKIVKRNTHGC